MDENVMETITVHAMFSKAILKEIAIDQLHSGTYQPRDTFSEEGLESLSKTIAQLGVLEPLIVRSSQSTANHYEIVILLGLSPSHVTNLLRLLNLDARIQHGMKQVHLSEGHGIFLAGLP